MKLLLIILFSILSLSASANWVTKLKDPKTVWMNKADCQKTIPADESCHDITGKDLRKWMVDGSGNVVADTAGAIQADLYDAQVISRKQAMTAKRGRLIIWCDGQTGLARDRCDLILRR